MLPEVIVATAATAAVYHHIGYPVLLRRLAQHARARREIPSASKAGTSSPAQVVLIVSAYNEAAVIAEKVANCAALEYPSGRLRTIIACDGCSDATAELARQAVRDAGAGDRIEVIERTVNVGKIAILNATVSAADCEIVALSDASAILAADAIQHAVLHFADPKVGVVCPVYRLGHAATEGESAYWAYQTAVKADEAEMGAPFGAHGAFYLFRRSGWAELPADTINDDVIIPMRIVSAGYRAIYDTTIASTEIETTCRDQEWRRRVRIGAGNVQQVLRLSRLADLRRPGLAFIFFSGKGLRVLMPFLAIFAQAAIMVGALAGSQTMLALLFSEVIVLMLALPTIAKRIPMISVVSKWLDYMIEGYAASFVGALRYLGGRERNGWRSAASVYSKVSYSSTADSDNSATYIPRLVQISKRALDLVCGLVALAITLLLFIPIALAIKLESRGPIFYRQLRVGRVTPTATHLLYLVKFRTMRSDAETKSGAVWASKNDPRITRFGNFMRKTRLDELPQCINVLRGEMSVIGPRPERPSFFNKLEDAIPFYAERTYGLKPGITGLAQVNQAYDTCIEDVRNKVLYDHAYAARLTTWMNWLRTDFGIIFKTVAVVALGKGQ